MVGGLCQYQQQPPALGKDRMRQVGRPQPRHCIQSPTAACHHQPSYTDRQDSNRQRRTDLCEADGLGVHDLVRLLVLQHPVLYVGRRSVGRVYVSTCVCGIDGEKARMSFRPSVRPCFGVPLHTLATTSQPASQPGSTPHLVDPRLVREGVGAHNGLVGLDDHARQRRDQARRLVDLRRLHVGQRRVRLGVPPEAGVVEALLSC